MSRAWRMPQRFEELADYNTSCATVRVIDEGVFGNVRRLRFEQKTPPLVWAPEYVERMRLLQLEFESWKLGQYLREFHVTALDNGAMLLKRRSMWNRIFGRAQLR